MKIEKKPQSKKQSPVNFTSRQIRVIEAWAKYPTIAIASEELKISEHTFQTHLRRMRKKIKVTRTFDVYNYLKKNELL